MYPYLKNKWYEINEQANTMQSLFSYIKAQRKSAEKILLKNPIEEILLKKFPSTSTGLIWLDLLGFLQDFFDKYVILLMKSLWKNPFKKILS